ncbi:MAG: tripartite tricarboxylate transporter substrate binding protein [Lautropia sp.]
MPRFIMPRRLALAVAPAALLLALTLTAGPAAAQGSYPEKPIRMIVPYPPGGGTDVIARIVQDKLRQQIGQTIVIDNRGGAAGAIGTEAVAKAEPDGYTVLFTLSSHTINPAIFQKLAFDTERDFAPVATVASLPQILVANPGAGIDTVAQMVAAAKAKPGQLTFGSAGNGSPSHFAGEMVNLSTGIQITHVPYRGGGPAVIDVVSGQIPLLWISIPAAAAQVKQGKLKALAVSTAKRSAAFPDVPTLAEAGVAGVEVDSWFAVFMPAKTPQAIIDKWNAAINVAVRDPDIKEKLLQQGAEGVGGTPQDLGKVVATEVPLWKKVAAQARIKAD